MERRYFVWQVKNIIQAFKQYLPEVYDLFAAQKEKFNTPEEEEALLQIYPFSTNISIDFGIMEKADNVYVIPSSFGWSDLGAWNSAYENLQKDENANALIGSNFMLMDTAFYADGYGKLYFACAGQQAGSDPGP